MNKIWLISGFTFFVFIFIVFLVFFHTNVFAVAQAIIPRSLPAFYSGGLEQGSGGQLERDWQASDSSNLFTPSQARNSANTLMPLSAYPAPETCGSCHTTIYANWQRSLHASSTTDPACLAVKELFAFERGEPAEPDVMRRPPRDPRAPFLDRTLVLGIFGGGLTLFLAVMALYLRVVFIAPGDLPRVQTVAFLTWLIGHAVLALVMRGERSPLRLKTLFTNPVIGLWTLAVVAACVLVMSVPAVGRVLKTVPISSLDWGWVIGLGLAAGLVFDLGQRFTQITRSRKGLGLGSIT